MLTAIQTGLRVTELANLRRADVALSTGAHVRCMGKGRKERATPLTSTTVDVLRAWLTERQAGQPDPLFPTTRGRALSRYGIDAIIDRHVHAAATTCPSLASKAVTTHTLRHTAVICGSYTPASTPPSSPSGSATSPSKPPKCMCTPT